ncbi:hypothetical protein IU439_01155 [Nocardia farcinica]|nr:hypothetical protein [Nocardia sp. FDAARGOS_372]MBF6405664.1 hypothetical protein [Nocardia farcinica]
MTENGAAPGRRACGLRWDRRRFLTVGAAVPLAVTLASCAGEDAAAPTGTAGPDLTGVDPAVRPQDDLFRHVNGGWLRDYRLPPDKASHGTFEELADRTEDRLREILEAPDDAGPGTDARRLRDLYRAYLDTAAIEAAGTRPLADLLGEIDAAATKSDLARVAGALSRSPVRCGCGSSPTARTPPGTVRTWCSRGWGCRTRPTTVSPSTANCARPTAVT